MKEFSYCRAKIFVKAHIDNRIEAGVGIAKPARYHIQLQVQPRVDVKGESHGNTAYDAHAEIRYPADQECN